MTVFGVDLAVAEPLVTAVAGESPDLVQLRERFARAAWSGIAEPGDGTAGVVVRALGAVGALDALIARRDAAWVAAELRERGVDGDESEFGAALKRWKPRIEARRVIHALSQSAHVGARLLIPGDEAWPAGVDDLDLHAPLALWMRGRDDAVAALDTSPSSERARPPDTANT